MNRGSVVNFFRVLRERPDASMRPRFMNRGSDAVEILAPAMRLASMRPRFMNRGSIKHCESLAGFADMLQ